MSTDATDGDTSERRALLDALYSKYRLALWRFLTRKRLTREDAADIVQETYCRIHESSDVAAILHPKAFLFKVANNIRLNDHKHRSHGIDHNTEELGTVEIAAEDPGPYRDINAQQEWEVVRAALMELPPTCRDVFVMNRFEGMSYAQIAAEMSLSVSMIEKHVSHALAHMRKRRAAASEVRLVRRVVRDRP
jgi:RNA polymerase sigma factor (sigma-70 family)